jgi:NAD(P)-dependent dehydrogenase (short-subunit alcohol dehydrogenase family)
MRGLQGKVALVAGAAPGNIGAATAIRLAEEGTSVVAADLNESAARAVADEIKALGGKAIARSFDITDERPTRSLSPSRSTSSEGSTACSTWPPTSRPPRWLKTRTCSRCRSRCGGTP